MHLFNQGNRDHFLRRLTLVLFLPALTACVGTGPYDALGKAGKTYAGATEQVLSDYRNTYLDARSAAALNREIVGVDPGPTVFDLSMCDPIAPDAARPVAPLSRFAQGQCNDVARVRTISQLISHVRLLGSYFQELSSIASSDAPARAEVSTKQIVGSLTDIGKELNSAVPGQIAALPPLAKAGLGLMQRAALRAEFQRNGETIRRELRIEARLLDWLKRKSADEQATLYTLEFERRVVAPMTARNALSAGDKWMEDRRAMMLQVDQTANVSAAQKALISLIAAFDALMEGGDADQQIGQLIGDVNIMLNTAEPFVGRK